ncbi:MAG: hypothetical protein PHW73_04170 [Atribacterota bacterium]|nr:hypothetical protein [Atribacterota bacterium]
MNFKYKKLILEEVKEHPNMDLVKFSELCAKKVMKCESGNIKIEDIDKFNKLKSDIGREIGELQSQGYVVIGTKWDVFLNFSESRVQDRIHMILAREEEPQSEQNLLNYVSQCFPSDVFDKKVYAEVLTQLFKDRTIVRNSKSEICLRWERDKWL